MSLASRIAALNELLKSKAGFVREQLDKGNTPSPPQIAKFLGSVVTELGSHVRVVGAAAADIRPLIEGLGWSVPTNSPVPGSAPPTAVAVLEALDACIAAATVKYEESIPSLAEAEQAVAASKITLAAEERELGFVEEDMDQEDISEKQYAKAEAKQRKLAASVASLRAQVAGAEGMVALAATVASPADLAARAERKRAAVQSAAVAAAAKSARKQPASVLQGGGRGGGYASGGGGGAHAAVKKAALVQPDSNSVEFVQANELRKGDYILINGRVCRVGDYSTSKTGKHGQTGHAKIKFSAKDVDTGRAVEDLAQSHKKMSVPSKSWVEHNKAQLR
eukprot:gene17637-28084_t